MHVINFRVLMCKEMQTNQLDPVNFEPTLSGTWHHLHPYGWMDGCSNLCSLSHPPLQTYDQTQPSVVQTFGISIPDSWLPSSVCFSAVWATSRQVAIWGWKTLLDTSRSDHPEHGSQFLSRCSHCIVLTIFPFKAPKMSQINLIEVEEANSNMIPSGSSTNNGRWLTSMSWAIQLSTSLQGTLPVCLPFFYILIQWSLVIFWSSLYPSSSFSRRV